MQLPAAILDAGCFTATRALGLTISPLGIMLSPAWCARLSKNFGNHRVLCADARDPAARPGLSSSPARWLVRGSGPARMRCLVCWLDPGVLHTSNLGRRQERGLESPETGRQNLRFRDLERRQRPNVRHLNPRKYPQSAHYSSETGKHRFASDCVVGLGGLEPPTKPAISVGFRRPGVLHTSNLGRRQERGLESPETGRQNLRFRDLERRQRPNVRHLNPRKYPQSAHYSSETGKHRFASDCVVGLGGLEPPTKPAISVGFRRCGRFSGVAWRSCRSAEPSRGSVGGTRTCPRVISQFHRASTALAECQSFHGLLEPETFPEPARPGAGCPVNALLQTPNERLSWLDAKPAETTTTRRSK